MKTEYRLYAALLVLAGMGVAYYMVRADNTEQLAARSGTAVAENLPAIALPEADVAAITKLRIKNQDKSDVTLEKNGDAWEVTAPVKAEANAKNIEQLLENLKALKATELIDKTAGSYEQYELSDDKALIVEAYKGGEKALHLYFGKSGSRGQMVRKDGTEGVFIADGYSSFLYGREVKNWRETKVVSFNKENVTGVTVENANGKFSFSKNDADWSASYAERDEDGELGKMTDEWEEFLPKKVDDLLGAYRDLRAIDFAEADADTGIDSAVEDGGVVTISLKDGAKDVVLKVGKVAKSTNRYALLEGGSGVTVVLSSWSADWATAEKSKFEENKGDDAGAGGGMEGLEGLEGLDLEGLAGGHGDDDGHDHGDAPKKEEKKKEEKKAPAPKKPAPKAPAPKAPPAPPAE